MMIKQIIKKLYKSQNPVFSIIYSAQDVKVRGIAMREGMELKEHQSPVDGKLIVLKGRIYYNEAGSRKVLNEWEEVLIKEKVKHSVQSVTDSLCLLIQG